MERDENYDLNVGLGRSVGSKLIGSVSNQDGSSYRIVLEKFFIIPPLLWPLKGMRNTSNQNCLNKLRGKGSTTGAK